MATSSDPSDDAIENMCLEEDILCYRGNSEDVLDRYYKCAIAYDMKHMALLGADNPLIDPMVCDDSCDAYLQSPGEFDFVSNHHPPTYPDGQEIEICSFKAIESAWREANKQFQREHGTPFIWDQPQRFRCFNITMKPNLQCERWTLDYPEDYDFLKSIFDGLYLTKPDFSMWDIVSFLDAHPALRRINAAHSGSKWYSEQADELSTV